VEEIQEVEEVKEAEEVKEVKEKSCVELVDGDLLGGSGLAVAVGGVEGVGGGGCGRDLCGRASCGAHGGGYDHVIGVGDLPGQCYGCARGDGVGGGGETGDCGTGAGGDVGTFVERRKCEDFEIVGSDGAEVVEVVVVPAIVGCAGDVHGGTIVGEDEAVFFHGVEDDLIGGGESGDVERRFEAQAGAHRESVGIAGGGSKMGGGRNKSGAGIL
jgi:hypothetical protein